MKYYLPDYESVENAQEGLSPDCTHSSFTAMEAMEHYHNYNDGWELKDRSFPITVILIDKFGGTSKWKVYRETAPQFLAFEDNQKREGETK